MPTKIFGLPAHVLLVHFVVVLVPLATLAGVLHAVWPIARRRLGVVTPLLGLVSLMLVPITTNAGDYFERHFAGGPHVPAIERHEALGRELIWYVIPLFIVTIAVWLVGRYRDGAIVPGIAPQRAEAREVPSSIAVLVAIVAIGLAIATNIQLYRIGDAGAHAVYNGLLH